MAPLAMEHIVDSLSRNPEEVGTTEDCMARAGATAAGAFFMGLSIGTAFQVHFQKSVPLKIQQLFIVPIGLGYLAGRVAYQHTAMRCQQARWQKTTIAPQPQPANFNINGDSR